MTVFKAIATMRELKQRMQLCGAFDSFVDAVDASGNPILVAIKGAEKHFIKIEPVDNAGRVDGLGLSQRVYSPHIARLIQEDTATAAEVAARAFCLAALCKLGMKLEIQEGPAAGAAADYAAADVLGVVVATIPSDEIHGLTMSQ